MENIRKFLMKRLPTFKVESHISIDQFYIEEGDETVRYRGEKSNDEIKYIRSVKCEDIFIESGETDREEFIKKSQMSKRLSSIDRAFHEGEHDTWEIDRYKFLDLIIAQVRVPEEDYILSIPLEVKNSMVMEVFGEYSTERFNDENLADNYVNEQYEDK